MSWEADVAATWALLVTELRAEGFDVDGNDVVYGEVEYADSTGTTRRARVEVHPSVGFPFQPPRVRPFDGSGARSWHQEPDGGLCLYGGEGNADWPWLDASQLVKRISDWYSRDSAGWRDDAPDLDLERYLPRAAFPALVLHRDLNALVGQPVRLKRRAVADVFELIGPGVRPAGKRKDRSAIYGQVVDLGPLAQPFHDWDELVALLGDSGNRLTRAINEQRVELLLVRYQRGNLSAVAALTARPTGSGILLAAVESADDGEATRTLRAGPTIELLRKRSVAIVGIGAVGGFAADLLIRDGVGRLTFVDGERLRPGNCVRHYLDRSYVGLNKALAMRHALIGRHGLTDDRISVRDEHLFTGEEAGELLRNHDLVINASASDVSTGLLNHLATEIGTPVLSVHLERDGELAVVHRRPLAEERANYDLVPDPIVRPDTGREGGCGDPVARSRPDAVITVAAQVVRLAVTGLTGNFDDVPATQVVVLAPQSDEPFTKTATLEW